MKNLIKNHPINFQLWTFIWMIVFVIGTVFTVATLYSSVQNDIENITVQQTVTAEAVDEIDERIMTVEITNTQVLTELSWIKTTLIEIKEALK